MADITQHVFTKNLLSLLKETFEGPAGSAYLDKGAGLFQTLDTLTADAVSHAPYPGAPSIAAHSAHVMYYVRVNHNYAAGREQHVDWLESWRLQRVDNEEWEELKGRLRREYDALVETLESLETWSEQAAGNSMAVVAHTAYHLGAIRHALKRLGASVER
jgi:hypothetical protein